MALEHITDLVETFAARVLSQYRSKPRFMALHRALTQKAQDVEDALWGIVEQLDFENATGAWADYLGRIVNEPRAGAPDEVTGNRVYEVFIRARILVNKSSGRIEDLLAVLTNHGKMFGDTPTVIGAAYSGPAGFEIDLLDIGFPLETLLLYRSRLFQHLHGTKSAGVRLMVISSKVGAGSRFVFGSSDDGIIDDATQGLGSHDDELIGGKLVGAAAL